ncbi:GTP-binding protein rhoA [Metarhizium anisopliae]
MPEVRHFCPEHPVILIGCKKDLRYDAKTISELNTMDQKPVTLEDVSTMYNRSTPNSGEAGWLRLRTGIQLTWCFDRVKKRAKTWAHTNTFSAQPRAMKVLERSSTMLSVLPPLPPFTASVDALSCKLAVEQATMR